MLLMTMESQGHRLSWIYVSHYFHLSLLLIVATVYPTEGVGEVRDICDGEQFEASCQPGEVVVIRSALYGRMSLGRCVTRDLGDIGCHVDVLRHMDSLCSGRPSCETEVSVKSMLGTSPCSSELDSYLEVSYECHAAVSSSLGSCGPDGWVVITEPRGTLASIHANADTTGTRLCPWVLQAPPEQSINLTLYDFGPASTEEENPVFCEYLADIHEPQTQRFPICGGEERIRTVYISEGNVVHIEIIPGQLSTPRMFLLQYEAIGCPDIPPPENGWVRRDGEHAVVGCNVSGEVWFLSCRGVNWIGEVGTCPRAPDDNVPTVTRDYCHTESVDITCEQHEVITVTSAYYGRMSLGRCVTSDYGHVGCSTNVLSFLEDTCSGQSHCSFPVIDLVASLSPCPPDLVAYLQVTFQCIATGCPHITPPENGWGLQERDRAVVGCNVTGEVWHLVCRGGHWLGDVGTCPRAPDENVPVVTRDFCHTESVDMTCEPHEVLSVTSAYYGRMSLGRCVTGDYGSVGCSTNVLSFLEDTCSGQSHCSFPVMDLDASFSPCPGDFVSYLQVTFQCTVTGCPDITAPENASVRREGDYAVVDCTLTGESWYLVCQGDNWIGDVGPCSREEE